jgi:hypothetical protein
MPIGAGMIENYDNIAMYAAGGGYRSSKGQEQGACAFSKLLPEQHRCTNLRI